MDLGELLTHIHGAVGRYVIVSDAAITAIVLWILHTYAHGAANVSPVLAITSPEKRCGKTTLLELLTALVTRPLPTSNVTPATIFRGVEAFRPTLLIDEADTFLSDAEELRGIVNSGHRRSTAIVLRTTGDQLEVKRFSTWCPKAIAAIGALPNTIQDRSIVVAMRRRSKDEVVERLQFDRASVEFEPVRQKAARFANDSRLILLNADPDIPAGLDDRAADNWRPLFAIADAAGPDWAHRSRKAAVELCGARDDDDDSARTMMLLDIQNIFMERRAVRLSSADIVSDLGKMEERPWPEWKQGKPITTRQLARLLKPFSITPDTIRFPSGLAKGYELEAFHDAFARYLPNRSVTSVTMQKTNDLGENRSVTNSSDVTDRKQPKFNGINDVTAVTDRNREGALKGQEERL